MKIVAFVMHSAEIRRILSGIGRPTEIPEFDPPYDLLDWDICRLLPRTQDGFLPLEGENQIAEEVGPDPPFFDDHSDPPFWKD